MKLFKLTIVEKVEIITVKLKASLLLNVPLCIHPLTITTEALRLVVTVRCSFCS